MHGAALGSPSPQRVSLRVRRCLRFSIARSQPAPPLQGRPTTRERRFPAGLGPNEPLKTFATVPAVFPPDGGKCRSRRQTCSCLVLRRTAWGKTTPPHSFSFEATSIWGLEGLTKGPEPAVRCVRVLGVVRSRSCGALVREGRGTSASFPMKTRSSGRGDNRGIGGKNHDEDAAAKKAQDGRCGSGLRLDAAYVTRPVAQLGRFPRRD